MTVAVGGMAPLLQVYDMNEALAFYRDALGFELVQASDEVETPEGRHVHWCWLKLGDAHLMLNTAYDSGERPPAREPARQAAHDDVCLYFECADVDAMADLLRSQGLEVEGPRTAPYGMRQTWLHDPDGYQLCFQRPA